jgi:hypothetical protein
MVLDIVEGLEEKDQTVDPVSYQLFAGRVFNLDGLKNLESGKLPLGSGFEFEFDIIGESHKAILRRDGKIVFAEVLACVPGYDFGVQPAVFADSTQLQLRSRLGFKFQKEISDGRFVYDFESSVVDFPFTGQLTGDLHLELRFPGDLQPRTIGAVNVREGNLIIESVHEYPNKISGCGDVIMTRGVLQFREGFHGC